MNWLARFIFGGTDAPLEVDGTGLQADSEVIARARARQDAARAAMGDKWLCHPAHRVYRPMSASEVERFIAASYARAEAKNVIAHIRRKKA